MSKMKEDPPTLYDMAVQQCLRYASLIVDIGGLPYNVVKPFLVKLGHEHLSAIESKSPHIMDESDELWRNHILREFRDRKVPNRNFRQAFQQYGRDKEAQLGAARERLKLNQEQYNRNKRAASVVALSEEELPACPQRGSLVTGPFKSRTMQSVARKAQATALLRKPHPGILHPKLVKVTSAASPTPVHRPPPYGLRSPPNMRYHQQPPRSESVSPQRSPPMSPPPYSTSYSSSSSSSPTSSSSSSSSSPPLYARPRQGVLQPDQVQLLDQKPEQQNSISVRPMTYPAAKRKRVSSLFIPRKP